MFVRQRAQFAETIFRERAVAASDNPNGVRGPVCIYTDCAFARLIFHPGKHAAPVSNLRQNTLQSRA